MSRNKALTRARSARAKGSYGGICHGNGGGRQYHALSSPRRQPQGRLVLALTTSPRAGAASVRSRARPSNEPPRRCGRRRSRSHHRGAGWGCIGGNPNGPNSWASARSLNSSYSSRAASSIEAFASHSSTSVGAWSGILPSSGWSPSRSASCALHCAPQPRAGPAFLPGR